MAIIIEIKFEVRNDLGKARRKKKNDNEVRIVVL